MMMTDAGEIIFNNDSIDLDFRVESDDNVNMLFVDGGADRVAVGTNSPDEKFEVRGANTNEYFRTSGADVEIKTDNSSTPALIITGVGTADLLNVVSGSTEVFTILDSGKVGIGTNSPTRTLDVESADGTIAEFTSTNTYGGQMTFYSGSTLTAYMGSAGQTVANTAAESLNFSIRASQKLHLADMGTSTPTMTLDTYKVGIGTKSPQAPLHIIGGTMLFADGEADNTVKQGRFGSQHYDIDEEPFYYLYSIIQSDNNQINIGGGTSAGNAATNIKFYTAANNTTATGTERMAITSAGYVGIGTTSPSQTLTVAGNISASGDFNNASHGGAVSSSVFFISDPSFIENEAPARSFKLSNTGAYRLDISSNAATPVSVMNLEGQSAGSAKVAINVSVEHTPAATLEVRGTISGSLIRSNGDVVAYYSSDERLKDNIKLIEKPIEKIQQLRGIEYQWNDLQNTYPSGSLDSGIIAQDVQKVLPQLVKETNKGYLRVRHDRLVGLLVESIKEQQEQINELKTEIQEIKNGST